MNPREYQRAPLLMQDRLAKATPLSILKTPGMINRQTAYDFRWIARFKPETIEGHEKEIAQIAKEKLFQLKGKDELSSSENITGIAGDILEGLNAVPGKDAQLVLVDALENLRLFHLPDKVESLLSQDKTVIHPETLRRLLSNTDNSKMGLSLIEYHKNAGITEGRIQQEVEEGLLHIFSEEENKKQAMQPEKHKEDDHFKPFTVSTLQRKTAVIASLLYERAGQTCTPALKDAAAKVLRTYISELSAQTSDPTVFFNLVQTGVNQNDHIINDLLIQKGVSPEEKRPTDPTAIRTYLENQFPVSLSFMPDKEEITALDELSEMNLDEEPLKTYVMLKAGLSQSIRRTIVSHFDAYVATGARIEQKEKDEKEKSRIETERRKVVFQQKLNAVRTEQLRAVENERQNAQSVYELFPDLESS